jgi:serine/threonine-protein kinase
MTAPKSPRYRVVAELGSGAVSTVSRALQEPLDRVVAIKALRSTISPTSPFAAQLEREARLLMELSHPNIIACFDFVKTEDEMYLVLEYVDGFTLAELLAKSSRLPPELVAHIGGEVACALVHAHERGIVHRDVKPTNILLSKRGEVKLVDFGIAQRERLPTADEPLGQSPRASARLDEANEAFGTPAYMSPEQILGEHVDARSDIFSLGVVLYECLAGVRPFDKGGEDRRAAAQRIRRDPATPLRARVADVPRALDRVVMRSLAKLPADRFAAAHFVKDELDEFCKSATHVPNRSKLVVRALVKAKLVVDASLDHSISAVLEPRRPSLRPALLGYGVIATLLVIGAAALELSSRRGQSAVGGGDAPLELLPARAGSLRVVASPWAEVWVDGQRIDITPFARAIPLPAGTHYVTLTHPSAPPEKRTVKIVAGESLLLDVTMSVGGRTNGPKDEIDAGTDG